MKHATTHNILMVLLAGILSGLFAARAAAQSSTPEPELEPAEIVTVKAQLVRLGIAVTSATKPVPARLRWEVRHDDQPVTDLVVDAPGEQNPLTLVLLLDLSRQGDSACYSCLRERIEALPARLHLKAPPRVVVAAPDATLSPLRWPQAWPATYTAGTREAFNVALDALEQSPTPRRALLVVTNRVAQLPPHIFEDADARLAQTGALIYLMTVRPPKVRYGSAAAVVARTNLSTLEIFSVPVSADYLTVQFKFFMRLANTLHVVSYRLPAGDDTPGVAHSAEVKAIAADTGTVFLTQPRTFKTR